MPEMNRIQIVNDLPGLRALKDEWNKMAPPASVEPWQSFSWMEAAARACDDKQRLHIVIVRQAGKLIAIAPLVLKKSIQPLRPLRLDFLGGEELKEPNRFVLLEPSSLDPLMDAVVSRCPYPIRLSRIPNDAESLSCIVSKFKKAGWITRILSMPYPCLDLGANPIKKSLKEDLRRARRKAEAHGKVRAEVVSARSEEELLAHLKRGFRIEASGWKGRNGTAIICNQCRTIFFEQYACSAWREGILNLSFLYVDDVAVAVQYAIESAKAYWLLNVGYDEEYRYCSPGNLLLGETIDAASRNGLVRYNLLGKEEPWTKRWTTTALDSSVLAAYRPNIHGVKAMISDALYLAQKELSCLYHAAGHQVSIALKCTSG